MEKDRKAPTILHITLLHDASLLNDTCYGSEMNGKLFGTLYFTIV